MTSFQTTIRLSGVSKSFGETRALTDANFEARAGEVHAIVGENGSGKSTLAKIMSGVLSPDSGSVDILGGSIRSPIEAKARGLATIFQEVLVADHASILDNLYVGRDGFVSHGAGRAERLAEAQQVMTRFVGEAVDLDAPVGGLPLSMKQWVVIARAVLRRPKILILDESSAALDLGATQRLHQEIDRLRGEGATVLIVTHRIAELVRIADRATILRDGKAVGVLDRHEITEERLLKMMTPADRVQATQPTLSRSATQGAVPVMLARGVRLQPGARPFDFALMPGMIVGLAGLDGQGQDLFAKALAGIVPPADGEVVVAAEGGRECVVAGLADASAHGIAWVSGDRKREGILPQQSIFENFAIGVYRRRLKPFGVVDKAAARKLFAREVQRLSIKTGPIMNRITSLSGGNQQKVLISRAFASDPRVIVLNDPARGVDLNTKRDLYRELQAFAAAGGAVVYLSSEIEEFLGFAHRVDVFFQGSLFRALSGDAIGEDSVLSAMFGQAAGTHVDIDVSEAV